MNVTHFKEKILLAVVTIPLFLLIAAFVHYVTTSIGVPEEYVVKFLGVCFASLILYLVYG